MNNINEQKSGWLKYATGEGMLKVLHFIIYGSYGGLGKVLPFQLLVTLIVGVVEIVFAGFIAVKKGYEFIPSKLSVAGAVGFGVVAVWMTVVPIYVIAQPESDPSSYPSSRTLVNS